MAWWHGVFCDAQGTKTGHQHNEICTSASQVLFDLGVVSSPEPFGRLVSQGMILGEVEYTAFWCAGDTGGLKC